MQGIFGRSAKRMSHELHTERLYWEAAFERNQRRARAGAAQSFTGIVQYCMHEQYQELLVELIEVVG